MSNNRPTRALTISVGLLTLISFLATPTFGAIEPGPFGPKSTLLNPASGQPVTPPSAGATTTAPRAPTASSSATTSTTTNITKSTASPLTFNCSDLRRTALRMSAHASNLANRLTTRTPDGGPYKRLEVVCKSAGGAFCNVEQVDQSVTEFRPGHPDADQNGNLKVPAIVASQETAGLNSAAGELKLLASQGVCGAKSIEQGSMVIVKYHPDFEVMMDTVTFGSDGQVARWSRTTRDGKTQNLSFAGETVTP